MNLLLDTCTFLWLIGNPGRISPRAVQLLADPNNKAHFSVVSSWEIAVQLGLGRLIAPGIIHEAECN